MQTDARVSLRFPPPMTIGQQFTAEAVAYWRGRGVPDPQIAAAPVIQPDGRSVEKVQYVDLLAPEWDDEAEGFQYAVERWVSEMKLKWPTLW